MAGQDIFAHGGDLVRVIRVVRDWLSDAAGKNVKIPGGAAIAKRYDVFRNELPATSAKLGVEVDELTFNGYVVQVEEWLKVNARIPV